jgi:uncharacterized membrane protein
MQSSLAVAGFVFSLAAWITGATAQVLVAGVVLVSVAPFTLLVIMPTNKRLQAINAETHADEAIVLLSRWNRLHAVRSALSFVAFVMFTFELILR